MGAFGSLEPMRTGVAVVLLLATSLWLAPAAAAAAPRPAVGFWETEFQDFDDQPLLSFQVRRHRGRRVITSILRSGASCAEEGDDNRVAIDRRGRFGRTGAFYGRFKGRRRGPAVVRVSSGPLCNARFVLRRTRRTRLPEGRWSGTDSAGAPIRFFVYHGGIGMTGLTREQGLTLRCSDGSAFQSQGFSGGFTPKVFPRLDGTFDEYSLDAGIGRLAVRGRIAPTGLAGVYRLVAAPDGADGRLCDSGPTGFTASPPSPAPEP